MERLAYLKTVTGKRILIAPLDWGLGHAVRCIPIIYHLLSNYNEAILAVTASTRPVLQKAFPKCTFIEVPPYRVVYPFNTMIINMFLQAPRIFINTWREYFWLQRIIEQYEIDAVISDNRFGLFSNKCPTVFITHQIQIPTPNPLTSWFSSFVHQLYIKKFDTCWIPDWPDEKALAPALSIPKSVSFKYRHIGWLSNAVLIPDLERKWDALFVLSGPEPLRTTLEVAIRKQLSAINGQFLIIRGTTTETKNSWISSPHVHTIDLASRSEINEAISRTDILVSRSGYTTLMDLSVWQKPALLIPTPGQYEQVYLGSYLHKQRFAFCVKQNQLDLKVHLEEAKKHFHHFPKPKSTKQKKAWDEAMSELSNLISDYTHS